MSKRIEQLYTHHAPIYDLTEKVYRLFGFQEKRYRRDAIATLNLNVGDTVVDLGCGTGKNFAQILEKIGADGHLIGVDLTAAMLKQAQRKIDKYNWHNVTLVHSDVADYRFPDQVNGVLSTFALSFSEDYAAVIERSAEALRPVDGHLVIADMCWSDELPHWVMRVGTRFAAPFGVSHASLKRDMWGSVRQNFRIANRTYYYFNTVHILKGSAN